MNEEAPKLDLSLVHNKELENFEALRKTVFLNSNEREEDSRKYSAEVISFAEALRSKYPDFDSYILYHRLVDGTPPDTCTKFDFPGKDSVFKFFQDKTQYKLEIDESISDVSKRYNVHRNLLSQEKDGWFACGMPVEEYTKEREEEKEKLKKDGYELGIEGINYLSKINGIWHILYHDEQITIPDWRYKISLEKMDNLERTDKQKHQDQLFHR